MTTRPFTPRQSELAAILAGRQTLILRPFKPQPPHHTWNCYNTGGFNVKTSGDQRAKCPLGAPGDLLWIKEKYTIECPYGPPEGCENPDHVWLWQDEVARDYFATRWRPAITMPRWASRHTLRVLDVREIQVQDITEYDACAAGIQGHSHTTGKSNPRTVFVAFPELDGGFLRAVHALEAQWNTIYGEQGWGLPWGINPWAWACEFEVVR